MKHLQGTCRIEYWLRTSKAVAGTVVTDLDWRGVVQRRRRGPRGCSSRLLPHLPTHRLDRRLLRCGKVAVKDCVTGAADVHMHQLQSRVEHCIAQSLEPGQLGLRVIPQGAFYMPSPLTDPETHPWCDGCAEAQPSAADGVHARRLDRRPTAAEAKQLRLPLATAVLILPRLLRRRQQRGKGPGRRCERAIRCCRLRLLLLLWQGRRLLLWRLRRQHRRGGMLLRCRSEGHRCPDVRQRSCCAHTGLRLLLLRLSWLLCGS